MRRHGAESDLVIGITLSARITAAVCRAGGLGVLDLGSGDRQARAELGLATCWAGSPIGIRVGADCPLTPQDVLAELGDRPDLVQTVVLDWDSPWRQAPLPHQWRILVEVTSLDEAVQAVASGAHGLIARGAEAGGRVGEFSSFVSLQKLLTHSNLDAPVWLCGGIGRHTAAAAVVGGAAGVVLDTQLALLSDSDLPAAVTSAIAASDGTDTAIVNGRRVSPDGLPIGQDAFLAARFADEFGSISRAVRAVRRGILDALRAEPMPILAAGSPLATALGTELPVVQGPMTRVSDRAEFAASVAEAGALPFIALALSSGEQSRALLTETKAALGDQPWGVGVLGFAADEVRTAQLDVIRELRPHAALIAGGNPAQAAALEAVGITTFLHVASPRLLRQFLDAGARRFVFEGAECGGHVGPRSSFSLWECQLGVLLDYFADRPAKDLLVLFAGGVHDARSAAMVAAMAEPLVRRGASVGVLMGTGYLFTEEAVRHGAVLPAFQRKALDAEGTELLETAPGHATRCLPSPFVDSFRSISAELADSGVPRREAWEKLEQLNVGRLRIASKGVRREDGGLVEVDETTQEVEGLFMAGQVAALRASTTTVAQLHDDVTVGVERFRVDRARTMRTRLGRAEREIPAPPPVDVAIVGMACVFPGATDLAGFWANILGAVDSITEAPRERWDPSVYFAPDGNGAPGRSTTSKWGGFLDEIPFDPLTYGIPPSALTAIEPVQLLALEIAHRALVDAGYGPGTDENVDRSRVSVVFGAEAGSDMLNGTTLRMVLPSYLGRLPEELDAQLPQVTEDTFAGQLTNVIAGRIANRLDFGGASFSVDAACGSSLAAVDAACQELTRCTSDMVLCGGADLHNAVNDFLLFSSVGALSPTGRCRTFASAADGIALGEGVACVVLKRRTDAERDGDRIYAVIEGVGSGSDGRSLGLTAPRAEGQRRALDRAYRNAAVSPATVGLIEAHGTGTVVGDRTELGALTELFTEAGAAPGSCALGSVKSQIGHTKCAAGLAGLIKSALAVHTGITPPTLHLDQPNPAWQADSSPFAFHRAPVPWLAEPAERIAGVSAFGFGGTNFHVVLRGHDSAQLARHGADQWPVELFTFHGNDYRAACREIDRLRELTGVNDEHGRPWRLRDLARTAAVRAERARGPVRVAIVAGDLDALAERLAIAADGRSDPTRGVFTRTGDASTEGKLALLFPGQGSQRPGMLADLFTAFPDLQRFARSAGPVTEAMFPPAAFDSDGERARELRLRDTEIAQPALGITGLAVHHLLTRLGVAPDMVAGHSYGELVALAAAGCFDLDTLLRLSTARARAILDAAHAGGEGDLGGMTAVAASATDARQALDDVGLSNQVAVANHNGPKQTVISGPTAALASAREALRIKGFAVVELPVACAFHSQLVAGAGDRFAKVLSQQSIAAPDIPVWANRTASGYPDDVRAELAAQIGAPVRFAEQIEAMYADGARIFVEAGPGRVLSRLVDAILGDRPHEAVSIEGVAGPGLSGLLTALAQLAVAGVEMRTTWLTNGRDAIDVERATPPARPGWTVDGQTVRTVDGKFLPGGLAPAQRVEVTMPDDLTAQNGAVPGSSGRDALVGEFLRSSRELIAAQRDVLLGLFGTAPPASPATLVAPLPELRVPPPQQEDPPVRDGVDDPLSLVVGLIAERTGYPAEMIEPDLDLEADLSVDSIKRTEVAGELAARLGLDASDERFNGLVRMRTTRAMADWITGLTADAVADAPSANESIGKAPKRFLLELTDTEGAGHADLSVLDGQRIVLAGGDPTTVAELSDRLSACGAHVATCSVDEEITERADGLILLDALRDADEPVLPAAFGLLRSALRHEPRWLMAVAPSGSTARSGRAAGLRGLFRGIAREYPGTLVRLVETDRNAGGSLAETLIVELLTEVDQPVVVLDGDHRRTFTLAHRELGALAATGAGPVGDGAAELAAIGLRRESVVLLIGGARGITAKFAGVLAAAGDCRIELAGRTVLDDEPEHPSIAAARDLPSLRTALAGLGHRAPAAIDRTARQILARREVSATLAELRAYGSEVNYRDVDVLDAQAVRQLIKQIHTEHGRIDGVIYAAGVIDDKLIEDKDDASFGRVFATKLDGASAVLAELTKLPERPGFVVLFGSVAAALGNPGQVDYAAANDALEALGAEWSERAGIRALTVHWGPWAPEGAHSGMVSEELARSYRARGIDLIDPMQGVASLLRELAWGDPAVRCVVLNAAANWNEARR